MTVSTTNSRVVYTGNGATVAFAAPFKFIQNSDLSVYLDDVLQSVGFAVTGAGADSGTVTFTIAPATGVLVALVRAEPYTQDTTLAPNGPLPAKSLETMADKAMLGLQQVSDAFSRSLKFPISETAAIGAVPSIAARSSKFLAFDASGNPISSSGTGTATDAQLVSFLQSGADAVLRDLRSKGRDQVSALDFMTEAQRADVVGGTGLLDVTTAVNAFLLEADDGYMPAGAYRVTSKPVFRSNQRIKGAGTGTVIIYAAVAPPGGTPVLSLESLANTTVADLHVQVPCATYPSAKVLNIDNSTNCHFEQIKLTGGGGNAGFISGGSDNSIRRVEVDDYRSNGFYVSGGVNNVIEECVIPDGVNGLMGVQLVGGTSNKALRNRIANTPDNYFGIHAYGCDYAEVHNNVIKNTRREAIALGGSQKGARVRGNTCYWDANLGVGDFGMSVAGEDANTIVADFLIEGNTIIQSALDGIGVAGWCQRGLVTNNIIRDAAQANAGGHQSGIKVYGWVAGAIVQDVTVCDNHISKVSGGGLLYGVTETHDLGTASNNIIRDNKTVGLAGAPLFSVEAASSVIAQNSDDLSLKSFTPVITAAGGGAITTVSGAIRYQVVGKFVFMQLEVAVPDNGTGATALLVTLPVSVAPNIGALAGREGALTGKAVTATPFSATQLRIVDYANAYPVVSGSTLSLTGILVLP